MRESMIERVARAIALASLDDETRAVVNPETWPVAKSYCDMARAAIEAMRAQPITQSVMERIIRNNPVMRGGESLMSELWNAMIDAALSEKP